jgi:hypothetical protein
MLVNALILDEVSTWPKDWHISKHAYISDTTTIVFVVVVVMEVRRETASCVARYKVLEVGGMVAVRVVSCLSSAVRVAFHQG